MSMNQPSKSIDETFDKLTRTLNSYGHHFLDFPQFESTMTKAREEKSKDEMSLIQQSYESYWDIIKDGPIEVETPLDQSKRHLRKFLDKFGLAISEKYFSTLRSEHIIEVYAKNHQQIFRSVNFFSLSSYNVEALTFVTWEKLFHRPKELLGTLFKYPEIVMDNQIDLMSTPHTKHVLTEVETQKKFAHELINIGCVFDKSSNQPMGYITMIKVRELLGDVQIVH